MDAMLIHDTNIKETYRNTHKQCGNATKYTRKSVSGMDGGAHQTRQ